MAENADSSAEVRREPVQYTVGQQTADQVSNVAGDQYNAYLQQVTQERASFARDIASSKTKARRLIWIGLVLVLAGMGTYFYVFASAAGQIQKAINQPLDSPDFNAPAVNVFGGDVGGVPLGLIGMFIAFLGGVLMSVGLVLHIIAASRRRQLEQSPGVQPPWTYGSPPPPNGR